MKHFFKLVIALLAYNITCAQVPFNLTGKTFEYFNSENNSSEQFLFISNKEAKLMMISEINDKFYNDLCLCKCSIEGNRIKIICNCEDKEIYSEPLKETLIYEKVKNTLTTTIHYDRDKKPRIFNLKK